MDKRRKDKINALLSEAMDWANDNTDYLTGLDNDCEEITVECLTIENVKVLLKNLKIQLLKDDEPIVESSWENNCKDITY